MKRRLKKVPKLIISLVLLIILVFLGFNVFLKINTSSPSSENKSISFTVNEGSTYLTVASNLKDQNLIKSEFWYRVYLKLKHKSDYLQAGVYTLNTNMSVDDILKTFKNGSKSDSELSITFKEGINVRKFIKLVTENTTITEEEILEFLNNKEELDKLISKYWFLTDEIKNDKLYYSLEGYLYPDTYSVMSNGSIKDIIVSMLNNLELKLEPYKEKIKASKYTFHEILTLASIIELEAANSDDRNGVAGVFYNRLNGGWSLGSDVTTYYGAKIDLSERDLYQTEIDEFNDYNTRNSKMAGKLPVGPICNPSIESIEASLNPTSHNYYYFVADKNKKTYFSKNDSEHLATIAKLKNSGLWYEY